MTSMLSHLAAELAQLQRQNLYKPEHVIASKQGVELTLASGKKVLNFCANNYLGLASHPTLINAAKNALDDHGYGLASVRFICGTQTIHGQLEHALSQFLSMDATILYSSCFDANTGFFETLFGEEDAIFSDSLNHASIIDGVRLSKAQRLRYQNNDMQDLEKKLKETKARFKIIATDGVFSMDGYIANLPAICELAEKYDALTFVDDSHAVGFLGKTGKGTPEYWGLQGKIDVITGTLGKALGGASGGFTSGKQEIIDFLRQKSRPYLFSNTVAPMIVATAIETLKLLEQDPQLRLTLMQNSKYFRSHLQKLNFNILPGEHPIIPIMVGDARLAMEMAAGLLEEGIYAVGFSYPVVPMEKARIRVQISAAHTRAHLEHALNSFAKVGKRLKIIE